jgi:hypothetical protein
MTIVIGGSLLAGVAVATGEAAPDAGGGVTAPSSARDRDGPKARKKRTAMAKTKERRITTLVVRWPQRIHDVSGVSVRENEDPI